MREILFRGKRTDNGEWVEGYYCPVAFGRFPCRAAIIPVKDIEGTWHPHEVDPDTVGQYTGVTNENGVKIFEGDIVRVKGTSPDYAMVDYPALITFLYGGFCAIDGTVEEYAYATYRLECCDYDLEVIGNIYDNPELLEGDDG